MSAYADPAFNSAAVTPSDSTVLSPYTRGLYVGVGGNVVVTMATGDITFTNVQSGSILPINVTKVKAATTATNIVALW